MENSHVKTVSNDMKSLVREAQELFREATSITGERADVLRAKGISLLDSAIIAAQDAQMAVVESGKDALKATDTYVQENPWKAIAVSAGVGLLVGMLISRSK